MKRKAQVTGTRRAGPDHAVLTTIGGDGYQHRPCAQCPWRSDLPTGEFPAEAFRISATTAYDGAMNMFACHMLGAASSLICAGFLLKNAANNIGARIANSRSDLSVVHSPYPLYASYRAMAIANGVDPDDPVIAPCRGDDEPFDVVLQRQRKLAR